MHLYTYIHIYLIHSIHKYKNTHKAVSKTVTALSPTMYMAMIETAEVVADRYGISREAQDEYALQSQMRTAAGQQAGAFDDEIVPISATRAIKDRESGEISYSDAVLEKDEGNRPQTTLEGLAGLNPVVEGGTITAGNASQLSDGASACVLMEASLAEKRGLEPLGIYRGLARCLLSRLSGPHSRAHRHKVPHRLSITARPR